MSQPAVEVEKSNVVMSAELVPFVASVISTERQSVAETLAEYEVRGIRVASELAAIRIMDQESYDAKSAKLAEAKDFIKEAKNFCEPFRALTYGLYQKVMERMKALTAEPDAKLQPAITEILNFERKKQEEELARQRGLEAQQRREEEERRLAAATAAEAVGMSEQAIETILTAPSTTPKPVAQPSFVPAATHTTRDAWEAEEDMEKGGFYALIKAAAKDKKLLAFLLPNTTALNGTARALKTAMQVPGYKAVNKGSLARKGR